MLPWSEASASALRLAGICHYLFQKPRPRWTIRIAQSPTLRRRIGAARTVLLDIRPYHKRRFRCPPGAGIEPRHEAAEQGDATRPKKEFKILVRRIIEEGAGWSLQIEDPQLFAYALFNCMPQWLSSTGAQPVDHIIDDTIKIFSNVTSSPRQRR